MLYYKRREGEVCIPTYAKRMMGATYFLLLVIAPLAVYTMIRIPEARFQAILIAYPVAVNVVFALAVKATETIKAKLK